MSWLLGWVAFWYAAAVVGASTAAAVTDGWADTIWWSSMAAALVPLIVGLPVLALRTDRHHRSVVPLLVEEFDVPIGLEDLYNLQRQPVVVVAQAPSFTLCRVPGPGEPSTSRNMIAIVGPWGWQPPALAATHEMAV